MNGSAEPVGRGVVVILLTGALLGIGFNYLGQNSRPARGLAWISEPKELPSLEDHIQLTQKPDSATSRPAHEPSLPEAVEAPSADPARPDTKATTEPRPAEPRDKAVETTQSSPTPVGASIADPDDPLGGMVAVVEGEGVPEIPDLDRPFAVQLPTVKRFFDASAAYIIDARDVEEFEEGHIPGAVNLPFSTAGTDPAVLEAIDNGERPIIVYCGGGTCEVSMSLAESLVYQYAKRKVLVYMGGFPEWQAAGYPVQKGKEGAQG